MPIVGIGASAGGLRAFEVFFDNLPPQPDMAFVLIQHLDPYHESVLAELLNQHTTMDVNQVTGQTAVAANCVYVIPPGKSLTMRGGVLHLSEPAQPHGRRTPIDHFFRSLAEDQGANAVCVILSGTGSDGALGLKRVKERGGVVLVQAPEDAEYDGMPRSALATGLVDLVAPAGELAQMLVTYRKSVAEIQLPTIYDELAAEEVQLLQRILTQLYHQTGHDFSSYKRATLLRRLQRRMQVNQVESLAAYLIFLRDNREEAAALLKDLLISVTNFFRDPAAFAALARTVIPQLFSDEKKGETIRIWVPGCATGEEAYSLAMLLLEEAERHGQAADAQIFATDLNEAALMFARRGLYPHTIVADVPPERLRRFFTKQSAGYQVSRVLQDMVLFAPHNLLKDAPFARLDLLSCRNLLIYLEREMQERIFNIFHYALRPGGYLFLGSSESADKAMDLFETVHKQHRIYQRTPGPALLFPLGRRSFPGEPAEQRTPSTQAPAEVGLGDLHRQLMLQRYAPPSALVDEDYQIHFLFGAVDRYLRFHEGRPNYNILEAVAAEIRPELRTSLYHAFRRGKERERELRILQDDGPERLLCLRVEPVQHESLVTELALVIFEERELPDRAPEYQEPSGLKDDLTVVGQLEEELKETRHRLQTTVEEYETSNEELKTSNEELQSMNEELRSTAEELETRREELRSTNEELRSVNQELRGKVAELDQINSDLENLIEATDIALLFLDHELRLKRYTPEARHLFNIVPADVGRPFSHLDHTIEHRALPELAQHVLNSLETVEQEVRSKVGGHSEKWFLLAMRPYRTLQDRIEGVVVTLVDISPQAQARRQQRVVARQQAAVAELGQHALRSSDLTALMEVTVREIARTLEVGICHVLTVRDEDDILQLQAQVGWNGQGDKTVPAGQVTLPPDSQAGYALKTGSTVVVANRAEEHRFLFAPQVEALDVTSGVSVLIAARRRLYGVLEVYSREPRHFGEQEVHFLQAVANVLGAAIERQQAEEALREREQLLEAVLAQMPSGLSLADAPSGRLLLHNEEAERLLRHPLYPAEEQTAYNQYGALDANGEPYPPEAYPMARALQGETIHQEEMVYRRGDGSLTTFSVNAAPVRHADGKIVMAVSTFNDISTLKQLQMELRAWNEHLEERVARRTQELEEARDRFSTLFHANRTATVLTEVDSGVILDVNETYLQYFGYERADVIGRRTTELRIYAHRAERDRLMEQLWERGFVSDQEVVLLNRQGEERVASASVALIELEGRSVALTTFVDVTRLVRAEQRIRALASALTVAEQRERERIALILHDNLQQLLHAFRIQMMMMEGDSAMAESETLRGYLGELESLSEKAVAVTRSLTVELSPPVLEGEGLKAAFRWLAGHMDTVYGLQVELQIEDDAALGHRDLEELVFQMVRELLFNIVKHTDVGHAAVALRNEPNHCVIEVRDEGPGMDVALIEAQQTDGYGLRSIRERVKLFNGEMYLVSKPEEGTTVTLLFPCTESPTTMEV